MLFHSPKSFAPGDTKWRPEKRSLLRMCRYNKVSLHLPTQENIVIIGEIVINPSESVKSLTVSSL